MIWWKAWRESRTRFGLAVALIAFIVAAAILDCDRQMARYDVKPPITFARYVSMVYGSHFQLAWVASSFLLGLGGLLRERALGTAQYTLSLPVSRRRLVAVRAAMGAAEAALLALIPVVVIPVTARVIGRSYPPSEALKFSALILLAGIVFFFVGLFCSAFLQNEFAAASIGGVSLYAFFTAGQYLDRWFPPFNMGRFLSGFEFVDLTTGYLNGWPWLGMLWSLAVAVLLFWCATEITERVDF